MIEDRRVQLVSLDLCQDVGDGAVMEEEGPQFANL